MRQCAVHAHQPIPNVTQAVHNLRACSCHTHAESARKSHAGAFGCSQRCGADWNYLRWNSYLSTRHKLLYVATPKVAWTSVKWWFAALEGYA